LELAKGANATVPGPVVRVRLTSGLPARAVDLFALELTGARRVRDDGDLVFYNQRRSADGCLWQVDDRCVRIALGDLADDVESVTVAAALDDGWPGTLADDTGLRARVEAAGETAWDGPDTGDAWMVSHRVAGLGDERCVVLVELYRRAAGWKVRAVSQGWAAGTAALLTEHGVHVEHGQPAPALPAPPEIRATPLRPAPPEVRAAAVRRASPAVRGAVVRPVPPQVRARRAAPLPPTLPEGARHPGGGRPADATPTRTYPAAGWGAGGVDPSEAPTQIVASPAGAWPAWPRRTDADSDGPADDHHAARAADRRGTGWDGPDDRGRDDRGRDDGGDRDGGDRDGDRWAGASRRLHVRPVARAAGRAPLNLLAMDPYDFERLVADLMTAMGYDTQRTGRSGDGGVDVEVRSDDPLASGLIVISVKRLKRTVGAHYVRELAGTVHDRDAIKGILVTTSGFGPSSYEFAAKNRLELIDGERLRGWLADYLYLDAV